MYFNCTREQKEVGIFNQTNCTRKGIFIWRKTILPTFLINKNNQLKIVFCHLFLRVSFRQWILTKLKNAYTYLFRLYVMYLNTVYDVQSAHETLFIHNVLFVHYVLFVHQLMFVHQVLFVHQLMLVHQVLFIIKSVNVRTSCAVRTLCNIRTSCTVHTLIVLTLFWALQRILDISYYHQSYHSCHPGNKTFYYFSYLRGQG